MRSVSVAVALSREAPASKNEPCTFAISKPKVSSGSGAPSLMSVTVTVLVDSPGLNVSEPETPI